MNPASVVYILLYVIFIIVFQPNRNTKFLIANNFMFAIINSFFLVEIIFRLHQIISSSWEKWAYISTVSRLYGIFLYPKIIWILTSLFLPFLYFKAFFRRNHRFQLGLLAILCMNILSEIFVLHLNDWTVIIPDWDTPPFYGLGHGAYPIYYYVICLLIALGGSLFLSCTEHSILNHKRDKSPKRLDN